MQRFVRFSLVDSYHDFSLGVSCFKIPDSISDLTQWITSIDDRHYFAGFKKFLDKKQIFFVCLSLSPSYRFSASRP